MDIRTFFNAEYAKLQTSHKNVAKELEKTSEIIDNQISEFEAVNNILRGLLKNKTKTPLKGNELKEANKLKTIQKKLVSSISKIVEPTKQQKIIKEKPKTLKITSAKFLFPSLKIDNAVFSKVNLFGVKTQIQKSSQSSQDFYRTDDKKNEYQTEKIAILKRINDNLSNSPNMNLGEVKEEKDSGSFFGNIGGLISAALGGGIISSLIAKYFPTLSKIGGIAKIGSKLGGLVGKAGGLLKGATKLGGKALPVIGAVMSIYDLVKGVKTGLADYSKYSQAGDKLAAQGALSAMLMNTFGNTINVVGSFLPGPLGIALFALGTSMSLVSDKMKETNGRTEGYIGEAREKVAKTEQLIDVERSKGTMVELRPNFSDYKNIYWEYNSGDEWKPIVDSSTGKYLSAMNGRNPIIQSTDPKLPGIQTYKLNTKTGGQREIVVENGNIYMIVPNVGKVAISTRKTGGSVVRNKTYVVGERQPETYVPNVQQNREVEKKITQERASLKKQQIQQQREIDKTFQVFFDDMKKIRSYFSETTPSKSMSPADNVTNQQGNITPQKKETMTSVGDNLDTTTPQQELLTSIGIKTGISEIVSSKGRTLTLKRTDGALIERTGNINWRAHNPGNIRPIPANINGPGVIGSMDTDNGKFLVFDSYESGRKALYRQLFEAKSYKNLTISQALQRYAPAKDKNDPVAYAKAVIAVAGSDGILSSFDEPTRQKIIDAFQKKEGFVPGKEVVKSFDIGSWKIEKDQEAFVHQGEIIVPAYHANKIRTAAKSGRMEIAHPEIREEYDIYSDSNFWINTFMPALANVVKSEFGGE